MPTVFVPMDREQTFLMPLCFREVLGEDHLVWTVLDVVDQLDLAEVYGRYGDHEQGGRPAYEPSMMLALLIYAYAEGLRSSRAVERACRESWSYRAITANLEPDHATIARFRVAIDDLLPKLFARVLAICFEMGLERVGIVAVDGTKIGAAASKKANAGIERLRVLEEQAARMVEEATAADTAESGDAKTSPVRQVADRSRRLEAVRAAKAKLDAQVQAAEQARAERAAAEAAAAAKGRRLPGRKPKLAAPSLPVANTTDADSGLMKVPGGFIQGYNAQAVVDADQVVLAAEVCTDTNDSGQLEVMLTATMANLASAGISTRPATALADAGYWSAANAELDLDVDLLIATAKATKLHDTRTEETARALERRTAVISATAAGHVTTAEATELLGLTPTRIRQLVALHRRRGNDADAASTKAEARQAMTAKLAEPANRALYNQRGWMIEGVFGQTKETRNCRRFLRRGLKACNAEWKLIHVAGNIRKAWRRGKSRSDDHHNRPANHDGIQRHHFCRHHRALRPA